MSPIGRIFVVLNIVLAAVIFGVTASFLAKNDNYRYRLEEATRDFDKTKAELEAERTEIADARDAAERLRDQTITEKNQLDTQKKALEDEIASLNTQKQQLQASVDQYNEKLSNLTASVETISSSADNANEARVAAIEARTQAEQSASEAIAAKADAEDRANSLMADLEDVRRQLTAARNELQQSETTVATLLDLSGLTLADVGRTAPPIDGAITNVAESENQTIVQINRGSNDQVKNGYTFHIFNTATGEYKGEAVVEYTHSSTCTAVVTLKDASTTIMQGDRVATLL